MQHLRMALDIHTTPGWNPMVIALMEIQQHAHLRQEKLEPNFRGKYLKPHVQQNVAK